MQRMTEYFVNLFAIRSFICRSTVLVGTLAASHERFPHSVGLLWMSDGPGTKALPTLDNITQTGTIIHAVSGIRTHSLSVEAIKAYAPNRKATGTCIFLQQ
jgi:hypothetical protein